jgi:predicted metal-binding membrane protein
VVALLDDVWLIRLAWSQTLFVSLQGDSDAEEESSSAGSSDGWQTDDEDMDAEAAVAKARAAAAAITANSKSKDDSSKVGVHCPGWSAGLLHHFLVPLFLR